MAITNALLFGMVPRTSVFIPTSNFALNFTQLHHVLIAFRAKELLMITNGMKTQVITTIIMYICKMKIREKITFSVRARLDAIRDKEAVRRGATLMALPQHAAEGAGLVWGTCDRIWSAIGDSSADVNWYTKRLTLSSVYSATVLYWLGDNSPNHQDTWTFLDRRIENVMQFEKFKAQVNANPLAKQLLVGPNWLLSKIKAPSGVPTVDLPGNWSRRS